MSRIGKQPIALIDGVKANFTSGVLTVSGSKGELKMDIKSKIAIEVTDKEIILSTPPSKENLSPLWGTYGSLIENMVTGVSKGFEKKLSIEGIGYKGEVKAGENGSEIVFALGFSHPVKVQIPGNLKAMFEKNVLTISGIDKHAVGAFAAKIRDYKKPEPYKGKGIRYLGETITMKQGKKTV